MLSTTVSDSQKLLTCDKCGQKCSCTTNINDTSYCNDCMLKTNGCEITTPYSAPGNGWWGIYPPTDGTSLPYTKSSTKIIMDETLDFTQNQVLVERVENGYLLEKDNKEYVANTLEDVVKLLEQLIPTKEV